MVLDHGQELSGCARASAFFTSPNSRARFCTATAFSSCGTCAFSATKSLNQSVPIGSDRWHDSKNNQRSASAGCVGRPQPRLLFSKVDEDSVRLPQRHVPVLQHRRLPIRFNAKNSGLRCSPCSSLSWTISCARPSSLSARRTFCGLMNQDQYSFILGLLL